MTIASTTTQTATTTNYQCIYCATPCDSLYRVYGVSHHKTIKLSRCITCQNDVDPYCERELMLVVLDCLLFRQEAYRHLFFHRYRDLQLDTRESLFILLLASSGLRAYVIAVNLYGSPEDDFPHFAFYWMQQTILSGVIGFMHIGCIAISLFFSAKWTDEYTSLLSSRAPEEIWTQIYLSMLLPTACHGATLFLQIWEDSDTVRTMGSCLILSYQWFALHTILRVGAGSMIQTLMVTILFVLSMMMRDVLLELARTFWFAVDDEILSTMCAGMELKIGRLWLPFLVSQTLEIPPICLA